MKKNLIVLLLTAGASAFAQAPYGSQGYGPPTGAYDTGPYDPSAGAPAYNSAPPPASAYGGPGYAAPGAYPPAVCGPGSVWVDGYYNANGFLVNGYCSVPPFAGAYWVAPGYFGGRWVAGYWGHGGARSFGFRGGIGTVPRFEGGSHFAGGSIRGFQAPTPARSFNSGGGANSFHAPTREFNNHSQGNARSGGSGMHGNEPFHGGGSARGRR